MPPQEDEAQDTGSDALTPELVVRAYLSGAFPMANGRSGPVQWYSPDPRAVIPVAEDDTLGSFHVRRSLAKRMRKAGYTVTLDNAFADVIAQCALPRTNDEGDTWISPEVARVYTELHRHGLAHSIEAWQGGELIGGIYGLALGGAFFGESMFSRRPYASQVCLVHLVEHLRTRGFTLFDVQFVNPHLEQFGVVEIRRERYMRLLEDAVSRPATWTDARTTGGPPA